MYLTKIFKNEDITQRVNNPCKELVAEDVICETKDFRILTELAF